MGLAREANDLWYSDMGYEVIGKTTTDGNRITYFVMEDLQTQDLAWDGKHLWGMTLHGKFRKYRSDGTITKEIVGVLDNGWGLTYDGQYFWASDPYKQKIYQILISVDDTIPPAAPIDLTAEPSGWTHIDSFSIDWTNPEDESGVVAAYYKLDAPPIDTNDGIFTPDKPFFVSVGSEGEHTLFVWLEDYEGNVDHNNRSSTVLRLDLTPPTSGSIQIENGAFVTHSLRVILNNLGAFDELSGMGDGAQMRFSNDGVSWSKPEAFQSVRTGWKLSIFGGTTNPGLKTVYVKYSDAAGNWSSPFHDDIYFTQPLGISTTSPAAGFRGAAYSETLSAEGGLPPYRWTMESGSLPDGLVLDTTGVLSGVPSTEGGFGFTVSVTDFISQVATADFTIMIYETTKGDVDGDGSINVLDIVLTVRYTLGEEEFSAWQLYAADVNGDGEIDVLDVLTMVNIVIGLSGPPLK